jgi:DNA adenine methylase
MKYLEKIKNILPEKDIIDNIETALKSSFYMHFRYIYNNIAKYKIKINIQSVIFLFIRNFAYSGMFRYNSDGHFNVPYGGIGYNRKNYQKKVDYLKSQKLLNLLNRTTIGNLDFEDFLKKYVPRKNDFIFLDPPYDSEFSTYSQNEFTKDDHTRLANYLINRCKGKWMLVIKKTNLIKKLYFNSKLNITVFDKAYLVSFMNRNNKNTKHLLITNY